MTFLELTEAVSLGSLYSPVWVNMDRVVIMRRGKQDAEDGLWTTVLYEAGVPGDDGYLVEVEETVEEILTVLRQEATK